MESRIFTEGRKGFEGGVTAKKYEAITRCPNRTASRERQQQAEACWTWVKRAFIPPMHIAGPPHTSRRACAMMNSG